MSLRRTKRRTTKKTLRLQDKKGSNEFCRDKTIQVRRLRRRVRSWHDERGRETEKLSVFVVVERDGVQEEWDLSWKWNDDATSVCKRGRIEQNREKERKKGSSNVPETRNGRGKGRLSSSERKNKKSHQRMCSITFFQRLSLFTFSLHFLFSSHLGVFSLSCSLHLQDTRINQAERKQSTQIYSLSSLPFSSQDFLLSFQTTNSENSERTPFIFMLSQSNETKDSNSCRNEQGCEGGPMREMQGRTSTLLGSALPYVILERIWVI